EARTFGTIQIDDGMGAEVQDPVLRQIQPLHRGARCGEVERDELSIERDEPADLLRLPPRAEQPRQLQCSGRPRLETRATNPLVTGLENGNGEDGDCLARLIPPAARPPFTK